LTICLRDEENKKLGRPTEFSTAGLGLGIMTLEKEKEKEE
jgi:hypothetical protein